MNELMRVTTVAELGGKTLAAFDVDGEQVAIAAVDGGYYAFEDTCPHRGCSLATGELRGTTVVCPCHGSEFDVVTGTRLAGPAQRDVRTFPVHVDGGAIEIEH